MTARESYTPGYSDGATALMARRTLASHGAFLWPYLRPGTDVLDIGCGPGSITLGIAAAVAPGAVIGVDRETAQLEVARLAADALGVSNATFEQGSVYELPYVDPSFDLVVGHALFEHLRAPAEALAEIRRVLRPDGHVALRSPDWGGFVIGPTGDDVDEAIAAYRSLQQRNGGDVFVGRKLGSLLRAAGFQGVTVTASYEIYADPQLIGEYLAQQLDTDGEANNAAALRVWMRDPDALFAQAWFEATATR